MKASCLGCDLQVISSLADQGADPVMKDRTLRFGKEDKRLARYLGKAERSAPRQRMIGGQRSPEGIAAERPAIEVGESRDWRMQQTDVDATVPERVALIGGRHLKEFRKRVTLGLQTTQQRGKHAVQSRRNESDPQRLRLSSELADQRFGPLQSADDSGCLRGQSLAGLGQGHPGDTALEELHAQSLFQLPNGSRQRRLTHIETACRGPNRPQFGDGKELAQDPMIESEHTIL